MILDSTRSWNYLKVGWDDIFLPVSETCKRLSEFGPAIWPGNDETLVIEMPSSYDMWPRPGFLPQGIPRDLSERMTKMHDDPSAWWIGQIIKYLLRYQPETQKMLDEAEKKMKFRSPIVGIHVRRTDKVGTEAAFHAIDEYMFHAAEFFNRLEMRRKVDVRRIYLASDDPSVLQEATKK